MRSATEEIKEFFRRTGRDGFAISSVSGVLLFVLAIPTVRYLGLLSIYLKDVTGIPPLLHSIWILITIFLIIYWMLKLLYIHEREKRMDEIDKVVAGALAVAAQIDLLRRARRDSERLGFIKLSEVKAKELFELYTKSVIRNLVPKERDEYLLRVLRKMKDVKTDLDNRREGVKVFIIQMAHLRKSI